VATYTIGSTNPVGASNGTGTGVTASSLWLSKRTLAGAAAGATWTALRAWVSGGTVETKLRLAIYDDLANSPNNLVGGGEITVAVSAPAAEYTFTLPGNAPAPNGDYWVGFHFNTTSTGPAPWYATSGGTMAYGSPSYASGLPANYAETAVNGVNDIRVAADAADAGGGGGGPVGPRGADRRQRTAKKTVGSVASGVPSSGIPDANTVPPSPGGALGTGDNADRYAPGIEAV
jgi:hypothetical protein